MLFTFNVKRLTKKFGYFLVLKIWQKKLGHFLVLKAYPELRLEFLAAAAGIWPKLVPT